MDWMTEELGFCFWQKPEIFLFSTASRLALGPPTSYKIGKGLGVRGISPGGNAAGV
jgi:hypothetical protein